MKNLLYLAFAFSTYVLGENCDKLGILVYEDLGCQPKLTKNNSCPASFKCNNLTAPGKCVFQGKVYSRKERIPNNNLSFSCRVGCFCEENANEPSVACALVNCLTVPQNQPKCYVGYDLEHCCGTETICEPYNDTTTCMIDGVKYRAHERFISKGSCQVCLCQKGWNGKYEEPFCRRKACDVQKRNQAEVQNYCAPVYFKSKSGLKCCPDTWTCPDGSEDIKSGNKSAELTCKYGGNTLHLGDCFEKDVDYLFTEKPVKVKCECKIPPLLTCEEK